MKFVTIFLAMFLSLSIKAQIAVDSVPIINLNYITAAYELPNGKYFVGGTATNFSEDWGYIGVLKNGSYVWQKQVKGWIRGAVMQVIFQPQDSTILALYSKGDTAEYNMGFMKMKLDGTVIWDKFYGFGFSSTYPSLIQLHNDQFTFGYYLHGFGVRYSRLCSADSLGDTIASFWPTAMNQDSLARIVGYAELANGNKLLVYNRYVPYNGTKNGKVLFLDANWNVIASNGILAGEYYSVSVGQKFIYVGGKYEYGGNYGASIIQTFNFSGNKIWTANDTCYLCLPQQILELSSGNIAYLVGGNNFSDVRSKLIVYSQTGKLVSTDSYSSVVARNISENYSGNLVIAAGRYKNGTFQRSIVLTQKSFAPPSNNSNAYGYPNPVGDELYLALSQDFKGASGNWVIYNLSGMPLANDTFSGGLSYIDVKSIEPGFYLLKVENEAGDQAIIRFSKF